MDRQSIKIIFIFQIFIFFEFFFYCGGYVDLNIPEIIIMFFTDTLQGFILRGRAGDQLCVVD
jgi:hypothetical protein